PGVGPPVGIAAEPPQPLPGRVPPGVSLPAARAALTALAAGHPGVCWDRLLFCAKESVYKAWFPLTRRWLGFQQAEITIMEYGIFEARLLVPRPSLTGFTGRWLVRAGLVLTAIAGPISALGGVI